MDERLKNGRLLGGRDAGVGDGDFELAGESNHEPNKPDVGAFDGVGEKVNENLAEARGITNLFSGDSGANIYDEVEPLGIGLKRERSDDFVDERAQERGVGEGKMGFSAENGE